MRAEIIAIGTELLMGETVDTNSTYLAARLPSLGIELVHARQVRDRMEEMGPALREALDRSDVVLITGGLGPTEDDITREAIAETLGEGLETAPELVEGLERLFRDRGAAMPAANLRQATLIPSARTIQNPVGTAPGWWVETGGRVIVTMPGVPGEMEAMWANEVAPRLRERSTGAVILSRTIKTSGLSESAVAEPLQSLFGLGNPYLGIYARADGIQLRIISSAPTEAEAARLAAPLEREILDSLGDAVWGFDQDTLEERVGAVLRQGGLTIATMESCTGGLLASAITDVPGSSDYFRGGIVAYAPAVKVESGVDPALIERHGVVSAEVAQGMAAAVRQRLGADVGVGVTGVAGPEGLEGQAAGTVFIAVDVDGASRDTQMRFPRTRQMVKRRAVSQALVLVYRALLDRARA
jgi:nicotinamide-nucleotide amidase